MIETSSLAAASEKNIPENLLLEGELVDFWAEMPEINDIAISEETRQRFLSGMFTAAGHMANERPAGVLGEWRNKSPEEWNVFQRLAETTNGWATPANVVTVLGFVATVYGGVEYARGNHAKGIAYIAAGRILGDALDGPIARITGTRGEKGAAMDAIGDKVLTFLAAIALPALKVVTPEYAIEAGVRQAAIASGNIAIQKMGGEPNPTESGKDAMRYIWEAFAAGAVTQMLEQRGYSMSAFATRQVGKHVQRQSLALMDKAIAETQAQRTVMEASQV